MNVKVKGVGDVNKNSLDSIKNLVDCIIIKIIQRE